MPEDLLLLRRELSSVNSLVVQCGELLQLFHVGPAGRGRCGLPPAARPAALRAALVPPAVAAVPPHGRLAAGDPTGHCGGGAPTTAVRADLPTGRRRMSIDCLLV